MNFDSELNPQSLASIQTNYGAFVVLFCDQDKLATAVDLMIAHRASQPFTGRRGLGTYEVAAGSIDDVVREILQIDPSLATEVTFLGDDDPMFDELIESLRTSTEA